MKKNYCHPIWSNEITSLGLAVLAIIGSGVYISDVAGINLDLNLSEAQASRPNIILVLVDDLDWKTMPYLSKFRTLMTNEGVTFNNFFASNPVCCPARASILRGQYSHNTQILNNGDPLGGFTKFVRSGQESSTIATWLQSAGYRTMLAGKYLNHYPLGMPDTYVPPGWDEWYGMMGGGVYYNPRLNENGKVVTYGNTDQDYLTDIISRKAVSFMQRNSSKPFFTYLAPTAPHGPSIPARRHLNSFPGLTAPQSPSYDEPDIRDKPSKWLNDATFPRLSNAQTTAINEEFRKRAQSMLAVEDLLENVINTLKDNNQLLNTHIIFASDNGFHLGEHRLPRGKNTMYEEDVRVPLVIRGPGVPRGTSLDHLVINHDLAPTFANLAGISVPSFVDGKSIKPLLGSEVPIVESWRRRILLEHWRGDGEIQAPDVKAIRRKNLKYIEYANGDKEFYDLGVDPHELNSLHNSTDPLHVRVMTRMSQRLAKMKDCSGAACRLEEEPVSGSPISPTSVLED